MILNRIKNIFQSKSNSIDKLIKTNDVNVLKIQKQEEELEKQIVILMINKDRLEDKIKSIFKQSNDKELDDCNKLIVQEYYLQVKEQENNIKKLKEFLNKIHLKKQELIKNKTILIARKESSEILKKDIGYSNLSFNLDLDEKINEIDCYIAAEKEIKNINSNNNISNTSFEEIKKKYKSNVLNSDYTNSRGSSKSDYTNSRGASKFNRNRDERNIVKFID